MSQGLKRVARNHEAFAVAYKMCALGVLNTSLEHIDARRWRDPKCYLVILSVNHEIPGRLWYEHMEPLLDEKAGFS